MSRDNIEPLKEGLRALFDEMLSFTPKFRKKTYEEIFQNGFHKFEELIGQIETSLADSQDEKEARMRELAAVIPDHAYEEISKLNKRTRERDAVDYNLNMAAYVVPMLTYNHSADLVELSRRIVDEWNKKGISSLHLSHSSYEEISSGFRRKLCYITTAVCESRALPDDCRELTMLRAFRDAYMMQTEEGKQLIDEYYEIAPAMVAVINMQKDAARVYDNIYRGYLVPCVKSIEEGQLEQCQRQYTAMVQQLKQIYIGI